MMEKIPPHNNEAEKSVLGAAMLSKDALYDVMETVRAENFYNEVHKEIFEAITDLHRKSSPVDVLTVSEELKKRKSLEMVGGRAYVAMLSTEVPSTSNAKEYARIVAEKSSVRDLISSAGEILEKSYENKLDADRILDFAEREIFDIAQKRQTKDFASIKDVLLQNIDIIDKASKMESSITGVSTGFSSLDTMTSGFQKSDLIIIAARPSMGKTSFALSIAQKAATKGDIGVLIFSLEMSKEQLGQRLLSMEANVDSQKLKTGKLERTDWNHIYMAMDNLSKAKLYIDDTPGITVMEIKNKCRRLKAEKGLDLVILDYLQLMTFEGRSDSRQQEITALSRALKQLAREMECPIVVLSQLSRAPEQRNDHRPILSDLRESGSIEQDADVVLFLYRDEYYNPEDTQKPGECEVIVSKQRNGPTGSIDVAWVGRYTRFAEKSNMQNSDAGGNDE